MQNYFISVDGVLLASLYSNIVKMLIFLRLVGNLFVIAYIKANKQEFNVDCAFDSADAL